MIGRVQVYTGNGKGKTTAAVGLAVRAAGAGWRVYFGQFLKRGASSELRVLRRLRGRVTVAAFGTGRFVKGRPSAAAVAAARRGWNTLRRALASGAYALVVADEINVACALGLLSENDLLALLDARPPHVELVFTGRGAPRRVRRRADLLTDMRAVRHYYRAGVAARQGIEF